MLRRTAALAVGGVTAVQAYRLASLERSEPHTTSSALRQLVTFDLMRVASTIARRRHDADCSQFADVQAALLRDRLTANADTAYGRDHGFAALLASEDVVRAFRETHPLTRPAHYAPYIQRIADGEAKVLNAEPETMLAATSGTSGTRTLLPCTPTMSATFFAKGILVVFDTLRRACPDAFELQRTCKLAFAPSWTTTPGGLRVGPNSSGPKDKSFARLLHLYSTPAAGYTIADDEYAALYVHALFAVRDAKLGIIEANFISMPARTSCRARTRGSRHGGCCCCSAVMASLASAHLRRVRAPGQAISSLNSPLLLSALKVSMLFFLQIK
jgi:hypothetical protein